MLRKIFALVLLLAAIATVTGAVPLVIENAAQACDNPSCIGG
jgi:hypothetical protein